MKRRRVTGKETSIRDGAKGGSDEEREETGVKVDQDADGMID